MLVVDGKIETDKLADIDKKVEAMVMEHFAYEEKDPVKMQEYANQVRKSLLEATIDTNKLEEELLESEKKVQNDRLITESIKHEREIQQSEMDEYNGDIFNVTNFKRYEAKQHLYDQINREDPASKMHEYKRDANDLKDKVISLSEMRRMDKNMAFDQTLQSVSNRKVPKEELVEVGKHIASDEERKIYDSFLNGSNGQVDLIELMEQMPKTMRGYLENGKFDIEATLDGIGKKADTLHHISDTMFHKGNTFQEAILQAEDNKRKFIQTEQIEEATSTVKKSEIDTELKAIRTERTQEKDNNLEERA